MTVLLLGGSGQLGTALQKQLGASNEPIAPTSRALDLSKPAGVRTFITDLRPTLIINAAAYTKVDDAEAEPDVAFAVNAAAPEVMALAALEIGARFLHVSTDYVFDGVGPLPYGVTARPCPLGVYGATKAAGEQAVALANPQSVIIRTAWVHSGGGTNFVATAVRLLSAGTPMRVVDDQVGTPTRAAHLARALLAIVERPALCGMLHFTDAGVASWYDVACCVLETLREVGRAGDGVTVTPVPSSAFPRPAKRPQVSILETHGSRVAIDWTPPHWREGVRASTLELLDA